MKNKKDYTKKKNIQIRSDELRIGSKLGQNKTQKKGEIPATNIKKKNKGKWKSIHKPNHTPLKSSKRKN